MVVDLNYVPKGWKKVKIPKVLFFQEGPGVRNWQFTETGVKLLNVGNINNGKIDLSKTSIHLSEEEANGKYKHFLVDDGDLLIACSGIVVDNFHNKIAFAEKEHLPLCLNTSTMRFKALNDEVDLNYFKYYLQTVHFTAQLRKLITGSAQLNFGPSHIKKIDLLLPPLETQRHIAHILDDAAALRNKTEQLTKEYDALGQSIFLDMFGDPILNPKLWKKDSLKKLGKTITGNTPSREIDNFYGDFIEWIKTDNINTPNMYLTRAEERLSELGLKKGRSVDVGAILVTCIAGSRRVIGNVAIADRKVSFNQQINAFIPNNMVSLFWYYQFILSQKYVQNNSTNGMKGIITKGKFEKMEFINPDIKYQIEFAEKINLIEKQKEFAKQELKESEDLFNCLLQKAFKGELV